MNEQGLPRIVVAVDGTEGSTGALRYAAGRAASRGWPLHVVHALPAYVAMTPSPPYLREDLVPTGEAILARAAELASDLAPEVTVTTELSTSDRVPALVAAGDDAEMLVLGQEGRHGLSRVLIGATAAVVAARTRCPLVAVPGDWQPDAAHGLVVVGVRSEQDAERLLARAFDEAVTRGAGLRFVHTWDLPNPYADRIEGRTHGTDWRASGEAHLESLLAPWRRAHPEVPVEVKVLHAQARAALVEESRDADLLLVLRHRSHLLPGYHLGGTARAVLALAPVPVEVVPPELSREHSVEQPLEQSAGRAWRQVPPDPRRS
ncbi:universal stress protein [Nocardioides sp. GXQ0305]|uniref:universal stress protein n=1 Tax=Nocardioides sp. GXQ0305 TaxID=3423912 RepID=UPI003D7E3CE7